MNCVEPPSRTNGILFVSSKNMALVDIKRAWLNVATGQCYPRHCALCIVFTADNGA